MRFSAYTSLLFATIFVLVRAQNVERPVADLINSFTFDFQNRMFGDEEGNVVFSPFNVYSGVALLYLGANGETKEQIENALNINNNNREKFLQSLADLTSTLSTGNADGGVSITTAVNGWLSHRFKILRRFSHQVEKYFGVSFKRLDFGQSESARNRINRWVSSHTGNRINELFPTGSFDSMTKLVLANAIYFKGQWTSPFDKRFTYSQNFYTENGSQKNVPFMFQRGLFSTGTHKGVELLELPYGTKGEFAMLFAKPIHSSDSSAWFYRRQPGDFADISTLSKQMTPKLLKQFQDSLSEGGLGWKTVIYVPRFTLKKNIDLKEELQKLGITKVFQPEASDLSPINGKKNLYVSKAQHQAFVQVDEEGTVADGATGFAAVAKSMPLVIRLNRPFLFYIIYKPQNAVLFAGRVTDPSL